MVKINCVKNIIFLGIFLMIFVFACKNNKVSENIIFIIEESGTKNKEITLLKSDYKIINYIENDELEIEITNSEKVIEIKNLTDKIIPKNLVYFNPTIYIRIQGKEYLSRGMWVFSSAVPPDCDLIFNYILDEDDKILFIKNNNITFKRWR
jgi:hypothetical protein